MLLQTEDTTEVNLKPFYSFWKGKEKKAFNILKRRNVNIIALIVLQTIQNTCFLFF